jgi:hypothetical protein
LENEREREKAAGEGEGGEGVGDGAGEGGAGEGDGAGKAREREEVKEWERVVEWELERVWKVKKGEVKTSGVSQPTLALGRQTSDCHAGQDEVIFLSYFLFFRTAFFGGGRSTRTAEPQSGAPLSGGKSGARLGRACGTPWGTAPGLLNSSGALSGRIPGTSFTSGLDGTSS